MLLAAPVDSVQDARSVREDTAELASYQLADQADRSSSSYLSRSRSAGRESPAPDADADDADDGRAPRGSETIAELSEPSSEDADDAMPPEEGPSLLARALRRTPVEARFPRLPQAADDAAAAVAEPPAMSP